MSDREKEVFALLTLGKPRPEIAEIAEIAETLYVSLITLKTQLRSIYRKLGGSRADALQQASSRGRL